MKISFITQIFIFQIQSFISIYSRLSRNLSRPLRKITILDHTEYSETKVKSTKTRSEDAKVFYDI